MSIQVNLQKTTMQELQKLEIQWPPQRQKAASRRIIVNCILVGLSKRLTRVSLTKMSQHHFFKILIPIRKRRMQMSTQNQQVATKPLKLHKIDHARSSSA